MAKECQIYAVYCCFVSVLCHKILMCLLFLALLCYKYYIVYMAGLNKKHKAFIDAYLGSEAKTNAEAAKIAGYQGDSNTLSRTANRLLKMPKVQEVIKEINAEEHSANVLDRKGRRLLLTRIAKDAEERTNDRIKAVELLGKMAGDYWDNRNVKVNKSNEEHSKVQDFVSTVKPEELKQLLDKAYKKDDSDSESAIH